MQKLKIVHVLRAPIGGLFRYVIDVATAQAKMGHDVGIFCDSKIGDARSEGMLATIAPLLNLGITRVPIKRTPHPSDITAFFAFRQFLLKHQPDIIHGQGAKGGFLARASALIDPLRAKNIRIYTPHGGSVHYKPGTWIHTFYMGLEKAIIPLTDLFVVESAHAFRKLQKGLNSPLPKGHVIHNGLLPEEFRPMINTQNEFDFVYLGELRPVKAVDVLIDALFQLREKHQQKARLLIVGAGPEKDMLHQKVQDYHLQDQITFELPQPIRAALARGRVFVVPSRNESLPYVVLEACAAARPIITTNVGGTP
jgi:glycosyltransferase involved in cell wall biosynthesis